VQAPGVFYECLKKVLTCDGVGQQRLSTPWRTVKQDTPGRGDTDMFVDFWVFQMDEEFADLVSMI